MASPLDRNRLSEEPSPYLQQHADNPVHWQPWDERALEAAAERDLPIFCSIGYAACHWCHVMEEESFEDERVARRLNESFVPIKVDREERPDVDRIYQTICQLVSGSGGWPLSAFLTPDGRPFFVGTYFPPEEKRGQPGFIDLLDRLTESWRTDREAIEERADRWHAAVRDEVEITSGGQVSTADEPTLADVANAALRGADREHGGFGTSGPKFPQPQRLELLLDAYARFEESSCLDVAISSLTSMADRGLYDHLGGGFHRYATDRAWRVPHFEKMLYDNAELPRVYLRAYQLSDRDRFASVTVNTLSFVTDELQDTDGGFYSTLDAQSEGREGAYYVWTPAEVHAVLEDERTAELLCERFGITESGNFEGNTTVLARVRSTEDLADEYDLSPDDVREMVARGSEALLEARWARPRPARDEKILAGWNGLMISAFADAALILDREWLDPAVDAITFVRDTLWDGRLARRYKDGAVGISGYLEDYAYLARGALDLYQASGEFEWLAFAVELADVMVEEFWDPNAGTLFFTPESGESLVSRPQDPYDQSTPSSLAVGIDVLTRLDPFVPGRGYDSIVDTVLEEYRAAIAGSPLQHVGLATVADRRDAGILEWTIVGEDVPPAWREAIANTYAPGGLITRRPPDGETIARWTDRLGCDDVPPIWRDRTQREGRPTVYLCRGFTCSPPLTEPGEVDEWLDQLGPAETI